MPATPSPIVATKIERTVEAIESLSVAIVASIVHDDRTKAAALFDNVANARKEVRDALQDLVAPTLRVVASNEFPNEAA